MATSIRSLADSLRRFDDAELTALLAARPDLGAPVPSGVSQLAGRAATPGSVQRAIGALRLPELQLAEAIAVLAPVSTTDLAAACGTTTKEMAPALGRLRALGLVWGRTRIDCVRTLREALATPAGLAPVEPADRDLTADQIRALLDAVQGPAREALDSLAWGPPVARTPPTAAGVRSLVDVGLLRRIDDESVRMPRPVQLVLRDGVVHHEFSAQPPPLVDEGQPSRLPADLLVPSAHAAASDRAFEALRLLLDLQVWDDDPPAVLRRGGIALREARRLAAQAGTDLDVYVTVVDAAWVDNLVGHDEQWWRLTRDYDDLRSRSAAQRWAELAVSWISSPRLPSLAGTADPSGQIRPPLSETTRRDGVRTRRRLLLRLLAAEPEVRAGVDALVAALRWHFPLVRDGVLEDEVESLLAEAQALGLRAGGILSPAALTLVAALDDGPVAAMERAATALEDASPPPVDEIHIQSDLTAVVPGRPSDRLVAALAWTEVISRGGALAVRFTTGSVRRALESGRDVDDLLAVLRACSRAELPQALVHLLTDERAKFGQVRVGRGAAYLVTDEATANTLAVDSVLEPLALQRIAPTVLITRTDPTFALQLLRRAGLSPVPEDADGALLHLSGGGRLRGGDLEDAAPVPGGPGDPALHLPPGEIVARIRAADADPAGDRSIADRLLAAIADRETLTIGIVDGRGGIEERRARPLAMDGGRLRALDAAGEDEFTVLLHRVTLG